MKPINVLSLFDGMACGRIALERAGIPVANYFASEIDKYAIKVSSKNYPDIIQLGSVENWKSWDLPKIDLLIGGSPCQGFSNAGQGLNFEDPRSKLFFEYVEIRNDLQKKNPNLKFLLENVKMKKDWQDIISDYLGVQPVLIDSALVSAQSRKRLYWTNWEVCQPEDRQIFLKDILEFPTEHEKNIQGAAIRNQVKKYGTITEINIRTDDKSNCVVSSYSKKLNGVFVKTIPYIKEEYKFREKYPSLCAQVPQRKYLIQSAVAGDIKGYDVVKRIYSPEGKSPSLTTMQGGHRQPKIDLRKKSCSIRIGGRNSPLNSKQVWDNIYKSKLEYRPLTVIECERLQTVPDNYTEGVSNSQRYKMLGNGWTVDVIVHILQSLYK